MDRPKMSKQQGRYLKHHLKKERKNQIESKTVTSRRLSQNVGIFRKGYSSRSIIREEAQARAEEDLSRILSLARMNSGDNDPYSIDDEKSPSSSLPKKYQSTKRKCKETAFLNLSPLQKHKRPKEKSLSVSSSFSTPSNKSSSPASLLRKESSQMHEKMKKPKIIPYEDFFKAISNGLQSAMESTLEDIVGEIKEIHHQFSDQRLILTPPSMGLQLSDYLTEGVQPLPQNEKELPYDTSPSAAACDFETSIASPRNFFSPAGLIKRYERKRNNFKRQMANRLKQPNCEDKFMGKIDLNNSSIDIFRHQCKLSFYRSPEITNGTQLGVKSYCDSKRFIKRYEMSIASNDNAQENIHKFEFFPSKNTSNFTRDPDCKFTYGENSNQLLHKNNNLSNMCDLRENIFFNNENQDTLPEPEYCQYSGASQNFPVSANFTRLTIPKYSPVKFKDKRRERPKLWSKSVGPFLKSPKEYDYKENIFTTIQTELPQSDIPIISMPKVSCNFVPTNVPRQMDYARSPFQFRPTRRIQLRARQTVCPPFSQSMSANNATSPFHFNPFQTPPCNYSFLFTN